MTGAEALICVKALGFRVLLQDDKPVIPPHPEGMEAPAELLNALRADRQGVIDALSADAKAGGTLASRAVNLAEFIENGIEPPEYFDMNEPLLLAGNVIGIAGEPEQGKTLVAAHVTVCALRAGKRVLYLDEEMGARLTAERLDAMGVTPEELQRLIYIPFGLQGKLDDIGAEILAVVLENDIDLIVLDSVSKAFSAAGLDENSNADATRLMQAWITPLAHVHNRTVLVLVLDHITKQEGDGRYSRGASAKLADVDVQWHINAEVPRTRTTMGRLVLPLKKDRTATLPKKLTYLAGGNGTGALIVQLEGQRDTPAIKLRTSDREALLALHGKENRGLRFAEWLAASKKIKSTFADIRKRLLEASLVEQRDDLYRVSATGIAAIADALPNEPQGTAEYGQGTGVPNRTVGNGSGTVGTVGTDPIRGSVPTVPATMPHQAIPTIPPQQPLACVQQATNGTGAVNGNAPRAVDLPAISADEEETWYAQALADEREDADDG
jgi:hypothetical protein